MLSSPTDTAARQIRGKVVVVGEYNCGKTALVTRFVHGGFSNLSESTIAAAFLSRTVSHRSADGRECAVKLELWDTAGSERYKSLMPMYFRDAAVVIVVYDVANPKSFERVPQWIAGLRDAAAAGAEDHEGTAAQVFLALVATKDDLRTRQTAVGSSSTAASPTSNQSVPSNNNNRSMTAHPTTFVPDDEGRRLASSFEPSAFFVTSAKTNDGVDALFARVAQEVVAHAERVEAARGGASSAARRGGVAVNMAGRGKGKKRGDKGCCLAQ